MEHPWERDCFSHVVEPADPRYRSFNAHPKSGMRDRPVAAQIYVPAKRVFREFVFINASK
jgi:hypothetical protein